MDIAEQELRTRIGQLELTVRDRDLVIASLKRERDGAYQLVDRMRENIEDANTVIENWKEAFEMVQDDKGDWTIDSGITGIWTQHDALLDKHKALLKDWNRFVPKYNAIVNPKPIGRPLAASEAQAKEVIALRKDGLSLRQIVSKTGLGYATIRTILEKDKGKDRTTKHRGELRKLEFDRLRAADYRRRKRMRDALPKRITEMREQGDALVKAAKGLGAD